MISSSSVTLTNNLLARVYSYLQPGGNLGQAGLNDAPVLRNNLFYGGILEIDPTYQTNATVRDNLFDRTTIEFDAGGWAYNGGYNAFVTNYSRLLPTNVADIVLSSPPAYEMGPLGSFYQPSNSVLVNAGSTTADQVALYHYTVMTNLGGGLEIKETNSVVDVSFHYVAVDSNGLPIDSNGDGIPDYLSDLNGNGSVDSGEIGWNIVGDLGLKVLITRPNNNSTVP